MLGERPHRNELIQAAVLWLQAQPMLRHLKEEVVTLAVEMWAYGYEARLDDEAMEELDKRPILTEHYRDVKGGSRESL